MSTDSILQRPGRFHGFAQLCFLILAVLTIVTTSLAQSPADDVPQSTTRSIDGSYEDELILLQEETPLSFLSTAKPILMGRIETGPIPFSVLSARSGSNRMTEIGGVNLATTGRVVYMRSAISPPWGQSTNEAAMNAVFGLGVWEDLRYETASPANIFASDVAMVFMEGGDSNANEMETFLNSNQALIESWVSSGGRLFLNAAPNEGNGMNLGFGTQLVYPNFSNPGTIAPGQGTHPIFSSPSTPVGSSWTGGFFTHASITCAVGCTTLIVGGSNQAVLSEKPFGTGLVIFGGMTTTNFHTPQPHATNLRRNILHYLYNVGLATNSAPSAVADSYSTGEDNMLTVPVNGVLGNDSDSDSDPLTAILVAAPANAQSFALLADGSFTYVPADNFNGVDGFTYKANDGQDDSNIVTVSITVNAVNDQPVLSGVPANAIIPEEAPYGFPASGSDIENSPLVYSLIGAPAGATIDPSSGAFAWTPTEDQGPGVYDFTVRVADPEGLFDQLPISVEVEEVNLEPVLDSIGDRTIDEDQLLTFDANASDADIPANGLTFDLIAGPSGASIDPSTGVFTWTPTEAQGGNPSSNYTFTVRVTDDGSPGLSDEEQITVTVNEVNSPPVLDAIGNQTGYWGNQFAFTASAGDSDLPANALAYSLIGAPAGASIDPASGQFTWPPSNAQIGAHTFTVRVTDDGSPTMFDEQQLTITVGKRPTMLVYTGDGTEQYSDRQALSAALTDNGGGALQGLPIVGRNIGFAIGAQSTSSNTDGSGTAAANLILTQNPAPAYTADSTFVGDAFYVASSDSDVFDITQEDARSYYTGTLFVNTSCATCSNGVATLSATIKDITAVGDDPATDSFEGDIRNARVTFISRDTNTVIASNVPVGLVDPADTKTGTATFNWNVNIGSQDSLDVTVGIIVTNYYTRNSTSEDTVVTISKPIGTNFITGGGYLVLSQSNGQYAGFDGSRSNFGFNVKYNKSGKNLQGHVNVIIRGSGGRVYQIKGTVLRTLSVNNSNPSSRHAVWTGKGALTDITDPLIPISLGGNNTFQMEIIDRGEPGSSDSIGINLWNDAGGLLHSSNWNGTQTVLQTIGGGNLVVR